MHPTLLTDLALSTNLRSVDAELTEATRAAIHRVGGDLELDGLKVRYRAVRTTLAGLPITRGLFWRV
jgi:hypothetical protein